MNRTIKLLAYTVFAILFPFWIFLGKLSEKTAGSSIIGIDTSSIKNITQGVIAISRESKSEQNPNEQLDDLLRQLVIQNIETSRSINELEKIVRSGNPAPGNIEVKIIPPEIKLSIPGPVVSDPGSTTILRPLPIADSINMVLDDIKKDISERTAAIDSSAYLIVFDITVTDRSINKDLDLRKVCCKDEKEYVSAVKTKLAGIRKATEQTRDFLPKREEINEKNLLLKMDTINNDLENFIIRKGNACNRRKILIGIRNVSNLVINLIDANIPFFQSHSKNQVTADSNTNTDLALRKSEVIYFKLNDICNTTKPDEFVSIGFTYSNSQNSFLFKKSPETSYFNIRIIR